MVNKIVGICLLVMTLLSCSGSTVAISDFDVIDFITENYKISKPDSFRISDNLEFLYYELNRYYIFRRHKWVDEFGKPRQTWVYVATGFINEPIPSIPEVQMELLYISIYIEREREKLRKRLLNEN